MVVRVTATIGSSGLQPKIEPAINFSITLAALLPQKVHLVATLNCCDVIRHTHSWLHVSAHFGVASQRRQTSTIMFAASSAYRSAFFMMRSSAVRSLKR